MIQESVGAAGRPRELRLQVIPEQERLVQGCYEALGYRLVSEKPQEHGDTELVMELADESAFEEGKFRRCQELLGRLETLNRRVIRYYLERVVAVGLAGAVCIGLSFLALHFHVQWLFVVLLLLGIFGCTVTLSLRPFFYRQWMKKYGQEVPGILAGLEEALGVKLGRKAK